MERIVFEVDDDTAKKNGVIPIPKLNSVLKKK